MSSCSLTPNAPTTYPGLGAETGGVTTTKTHPIKRLNTASNSIPQSKHFFKSPKRLKPDHFVPQNNQNLQVSILLPLENSEEKISCLPWVRRRRSVSAGSKRRGRGRRLVGPTPAMAARGSSVGTRMERQDRLRSAGISSARDRHVPSLALQDGLGPAAAKLAGRPERRGGESVRLVSQLAARLELTRCEGFI